MMPIKTRSLPRPPTPFFKVPQAPQNSKLRFHRPLRESMRRLRRLRHLSIKAPQATQNTLRHLRRLHPEQGVAGIPCMNRKCLSYLASPLLQGK